VRIAIFAALAGLAVASVASAQDKGKRSAPVDLAVSDGDLGDVVDEIGRKLRVNIIVEPDIHEKLTITLEKTPLIDALAAIASATGCEVEERGPIFVFTQPPRVTLEVQDEEVRSIFDRLLEPTGKSVIFSPRVIGKTSVSWKDVPRKKALAELCEKLSLQIDCRGDVLVVRPGKASVVLSGETRPSPSAFVENGGKKLSVAFEEAPLSQVCAYLSDKLGRKISCAQDVSEKVTISLREIPWPDMVRVVAKMLDCTVEKDADGTVQIAKLRRVTVSLDEVPVRTCFQKIAEQAKKKCFIGDGVDGKATLSLENVPWRDAAFALALAHDLELREKPDGSLDIAPKPAAGDRR